MNQKHREVLKDSENSTTYKKVGCQSALCAARLALYVPFASCPSW